MICQKKSLTTDSKSSTSDYFISSHPRSSRTWCLLFLAALFLCSAAPSAQGNGIFLCNPFEPATCRFGGQCSSMSTVPRLSADGNFQPGEYVCRCEAFECTSMGFDPVCGDDGQTYVNDVCRRAQECATQTPIERRCKGICGKADCEEILDTTLRCPPNESGRCTNFGECLLSEETGEPYCRCLLGFFGQRCEFRLVDPSRNVKTPMGHEESSFKIAFLCVVAVLGLVLILQTAYCVMRCRDASSKESNSAGEGKKSSQQSHDPEVLHQPKAQEEVRLEEVTITVDNDG